MFSGLTVVLALLGMFIIPETFQAFGVGATVVVFVAVFAGVTITCINWINGRQS